MLPRPVGPLLAAAALLYGWTAYRGPGVGHINDDAHYVLGAQALLHGSYTETLDPASPRPFPYPPGYPLLLAPVVAILRPHWDALQAVSIILTLLSGWLLYHLAEWSLAPGLGLWAAALWLFCPTTVRLAAPVMSEPLAAAGILASLLWLRRLLETPSDHVGSAFSLGLLAGYGALVRYPALLLAPAMVAGLAAGGRKRLAAPVLLGAALPVAAFVLWLHARTGDVTQYDSAWRLGLAYLGEPAGLFDHAVRFLHTTFVYGLLGVELPYSAASALLSLAMTAALLSPLAALPAVLREAERPRRGVLAATGAFSALWLGLHLFWPFIGARFSYPAFAPLIALWLACARHLAGRRDTLRRSALPAAAAVLGLLYPYRLRADARLAVTRYRPPERTLAWAREHLPADAKILARMSAEWHLLTGRSTVASVAAADPEGFRRALLEAGVTHVASQPLSLKLPAYGGGLAGPPPSWLADYPVAHAEPEEGAAIYEVR